MPEAAERMAAPRPACCVPTKLPASERSEPTKFAALRLPRTNRWLRTVPVPSLLPGLACRDNVRPTVRAPNICASTAVESAKSQTMASSGIQAEVKRNVLMACPSKTSKDRSSLWRTEDLGPPDRMMQSAENLQVLRDKTPRPPWLCIPHSRRLFKVPTPSKPLARPRSGRPCVQNARSSDHRRSLESSDPSSNERPWHPS